MPLSIRLDTETDTALEEIAERRSQTKSEVVRRAIRELVRRERLTPYEMAEDLIGSVSGGPEDLSARTGEKFRQLLLRKRRSRNE